MKIRKIPYFSQWANPEFTHAIVSGADPCADPRWPETGFSDADEYRFWGRRICGLACLQSILDYYGIPYISRKALLISAIEAGAYRLRNDGGVDGLIYAPFLQMLEQKFKLKGKVLQGMTSAEIPAVLPEDGFIIWSVSSEIRYPNDDNYRKGGHLVLIHSAMEHSCVFHNPSGVAPYQMDAKLELNSMERFSSNRGMLIERDR
ncbi:hypothetical protein FXE87_09580 [Vibrio mimicus]|uniref:hypothetical protein n=1 Tax=Vibrio mimicus TaxID=674 RepID=UPI0011DB57C0|nr:hypothetical protein [Vibrio mimicus]TXY25973.1 hypothetical protein FXE87_09580 [Vibrio mimicus]